MGDEVTSKATWQDGNENAITTALCLLVLKVDIGYQYIGQIEHTTIANMGTNYRTVDH